MVHGADDRYLPSAQGGTRSAGSWRAIDGLWMRPAAGNVQTGFSLPPSWRGSSQGGGFVLPRRDDPVIRYCRRIEFMKENCSGTHD